MNSMYPGYDVMAEQAHWDERTRRIVADRLVKPSEPRFFTSTEFTCIQVLIGALVGDADEGRLLRVAGQLDEHLAKRRGQGYHPTHLPDEEVLWRYGLGELERTAVAEYGRSFVALTPLERDNLLLQVQQGTVTWATVPAKDFFQHALLSAVDFFFSQPDIWSEIGFGGPAYPRGYYRLESGLKDPWEPVLNTEQMQKRRGAGLGPSSMPDDPVHGVAVGEAGE
ncbi:gluconate 2-dehydrogenase subunit 3 family protein [Heliophilum fasciatum]|uniref:Gluconate 2-dehydrogenase subunit 3-like protein n=1 Tax=Heliophilum fasciatum TaxID=35700 RepID=A0A4R2S965_9FIRM|nr:gluconate 2-dehydrogenase subunit 3 family protein [Heliophilum fasciatum]MCW2276658.1 hypothetical protein [Heliophilum fasciatum]TCP68961.1 gluconate 2-dehydrogenase subunit 3-like protein [Heliophilum fasciatum]